MNNASFRRKVRKRLERVLDKSETHCGHDDLYDEFLEAQEKFLDWMLVQVEKERSRANVEARRAIGIETSIG